MDVFPLKSIDAVLGSVVDQIVADIQILVMREDQPFVRVRAEMSLHPPELVDRM